MRFDNHQVHLSGKNRSYPSDWIGNKWSQSGQSGWSRGWTEVQLEVCACAKSQSGPIFWQDRRQKWKWNWPQICPTSHWSGRLCLNTLSLLAYLSMPYWVDNPFLGWHNRVQKCLLSRGKRWVGRKLEVLHQNLLGIWKLCVVSQIDSKKLQFDLW